MASVERRNHGKFNKKRDLAIRSRNVAVNKPDLTKYQQPPSYTFDVTLNLKRKSADVSPAALDTKKLKLADTSAVTLETSKKGKHVTFNLVEKVHHAEAAPVYAKTEEIVESEDSDDEDLDLDAFNKEWQRQDDLEFEEELLTDHRACYFAENIEGGLDFLGRMNKHGLSFEQADGESSYFRSFIGRGGFSELLERYLDEDSDEESD